MAIAAFMAVPAQAAVPTTLSATQVTATGAVLNGTVQTGNVATAYEFQYGTSTAYGKTTAVTVIPAGKGAAAIAVSAHISGLSPFTTYHFRLAVAIVIVGPKPYYKYYTVGATGADLLFKTRRAGNITLQRGKLNVIHHRVKTKLICNSTVACAGRVGLELVIKTRHKKQTKTKIYVCGSTKFSLGAGRNGTFTIKVNDTCIRLLKHAKHHRLPGKLVATVTTSQNNSSSNITLVYKS